MRLTILSVMMLLVAAANVNAATVVKNADITVSETWTPDNTYDLQSTVSVTNGATLTILPGTKIISTTTVNGAGALIITRGSKIFANGTATNPIIFTSDSDNFTSWQEGASQWGNLTIMGNGYVGDHMKENDPNNTNAFNANNVVPMEGLSGNVNDPNVVYGGGDDDDSSGCISYISLRYGGRVVGSGDELNGLSLGGIGRETVIHHIDITNNVDDGCEIWGGTVNIKYLNIWNIGDDSLDIDQGYRGCIQFVCIVQGYSTNASQGSGVGDNCIELDGRDGQTDGQPVTACTIYNATVVGSPKLGVQDAGDNGLSLRDNGNVQIRNSIFVDIGKDVIKNDGDDGDSPVASAGYGHNGTLDFATRWQTAYTWYHNVANFPNSDEDGGDSNAFFMAAYTAQGEDANIGAASGNLLSVTGTLYSNNNGSGAYTLSDTVGPNPGGGVTVTVAGGDSPTLDNRVDATFPFNAITRTAPITLGSHDISRVTFFDPRPTSANAQALNGAAPAPDNGIYTPVKYRGAFSPHVNWLVGWTHASEWGLTTDGSTDKVVGKVSVELLLTCISFEDEAGVCYVIECSEKGKDWDFVAQHVGDGGAPAVIADILGAGFENNKVYRVVIH